MRVTGQVREEVADLRFAHLCRMTVVTGSDESPDPPNMRILGSMTKMPGTNGLAYLVEERGDVGRRLRTLRFMWWLSMVGHSHWTKRRIDLNRLPGNECQRALQHAVDEPGIRQRTPSA